MSNIIEELDSVLLGRKGPGWANRARDEIVSLQSELADLKETNEILRVIRQEIEDRMIQANLDNSSTVMALRQELETVRARLSHWQAIADARLPSEWQPIETSPKDGTTILIFYRNECGKDRTIKAFFAEKYSLESSDDGSEYCEEKDEYFAPEGWYEVIDNWEDYSSVFVQHEPTHWMPLPEPPAGTEGNGDGC